MKGSPASCWDKALALVKQHVTPQQFDTWFKPIGFEHFNEEEKTILVQVPSPFVYEYLEENFLGLLRAVLYRTFGEGVQLTYRIVTDKEHKLTQDIASDESNADTDAVQNVLKQVEKQAAAVEFDSQLDPHLTFKNYIE